MGLALLVVAGAVLDAGGPRAGVEVRVVDEKPMTCPCAPADEEIGYENDIPDCRCPAALAMWRQRLAHCTAAKPLQVTRSDKAGRVALDPRVLGRSVEAWTTTGIKWLSVPKSADQIAIELEPPVRPRLRVDTNAELRAALMFEDGHCVPLQREAGATWIAATPIPKPVDSWPTLVVEAKGYATVVRSWYEEADEPLELSLAKAASIQAPCAGDRVKVENVFQELVVPVSRGRFRVEDLIDVETTLTCMRGARSLENWTYTREDGLQESGTVFSDTWMWGDCKEVEVTDRAGRPLADAEVGVFHVQGQSGGASWGSGTSTTTDKRGKACVADAYAGGELTVHAPPERGGQCGGDAKLKLTDAMLAKPIRIRLDIAPLTRATWRGRLLTAERVPVAGAAITIEELEPSEVKNCSSAAALVVYSGVDGRFELPLVPQGKAKLAIGHAWYLPVDRDVAVPGPARELVLDRGMTWTGKLLDQTGAAIARCDITLELPDGRRVSGQCGPHGFTLRTVVPGDAELVVHRLDAPDDAPPDERMLRRTIEIKPGKAFALDVTWPKASREHVLDVP